MKRWSRFLLALIIGMALGLFYGWILKPVEVINISPSMLDLGYRSDISLMVSEIFASTSDLDAAFFSLTNLFSQTPSATLADTLSYARDTGYTQTDTAVLQALANALQARLPGVSP